MLLGGLSGIILLAGSLIGGRGGLVVALVLALGINGFSYLWSDKLALRSMRAYPVAPQDQPRLHAIVVDLAQRAGAPVPRLYLSPTQAPNAFATGRSPQHAAVCCTEGIMALMDDRELRGVLGHELSHVYNRDILISSVAAALATAISFIANFAQLAAMFGGGRDRENGPGIGEVLLLAIVGPLAASVIQLALSRAREFQADASGAPLTGDPLGLASALLKLERGTQAAPLPANAQLGPTSALMIANPFCPGRMASLFSTHPPIPERVARLEQMAGFRR